MLIAFPLSYFMAGQRMRIEALNQELTAANADLQRLNALNEKRATIDAMTGLFNRQHFLDQSKQFRRMGISGTLMMIDADRFKLINDTFGHAAGDDALKKISFAISQAVRAEDFVGRMGGEEFAVYLTNCTGENAINIAERVRRNVAAIQFRPGEGRLHPLSVSIGLTEDASLVSFEEIMRKADKAMYASKSQGRDKVCVFPTTPSAVAA